MIDDSKQRYGSVSRFFHWAMVILLVWQGMKFFDRINEGEHWIGQTFVPWHISIGALILLTVILRLIWAGKQRRNRPEQEPATAFLVKLGHGLMYAGIVLMPITGIMYMVGNGHGLAPFGIQLVAKGPEVPWLASLGELHSPIAWVLLALVVGHIAIALYHGLVKKDGVLQRML